MARVRGLRRGKDALSGVVYPVTSAWDVPLMVARGYASLSVLRGAAEQIATADRPVVIHHLGDVDPSGVDAGRRIEAELRAGAPDADLHFERLAVPEAQIAGWRLPTRPTRQTDTRARGFGAISVELDAIPPHRLRALVEDALVRPLPRRQPDLPRQVEADERCQVLEIARILGGRPNDRPRDPLRRDHPACLPRRGRGAGRLPALGLSGA